MTPERHPTVRTLAAVSALQDLGSKMTVPILPLFLTGPLGAPIVVVGLVDGIADLSAAASRLISGRRSDRGSRSNLVRAGYGTAMLARVLLALAWAWPIVLAARFIDRIGKGVRAAPRDAMIADAVPVSMRGRAFGFHRGSEKVGAALGPLVGALVYSLSGRQLRVVLLVSIVPGVAATLLTLRLRDDRPTPAIGDRTEPARLPRQFWLAAWPLWAASLVVVSESFVLLRSSAVGVGTSLLLVLFAAANLVQAVVGPRIGSWTDRHSTAPAIALGIIGAGASLLALAVAATWWQIALLLPVFGVAVAATEAATKSRVIASASSDLRGTALGVFQAGQGVASLFGGLLVGGTWGGDGSVPLAVAGALAIPIAAWIRWSPASMSDA